MPAKVLAQRFALLALASAAVALLILSKTHSDATERIRTAIVDTVATVLNVLSQPVDALNQAVAEFDRFWFTYTENERLREEIDRLRRWQMVARGLEQQNAALRALTGLRAEALPSFISARVIGDSGGPFVRTMLVNAGERSGVAKGQAVVTGVGLVGRIAEVGDRSARLLLLIDLNSRVPVVIESSRHRAVLAGDNSERPRLIFLPPSAQVAPGDRIVTSGHGGVFPAGLPVGTVTAVSDGDIRVQPFVDWDRLEYVSVVRFDLPRLDASDIEVRRLP